MLSTILANNARKNLNIMFAPKFLAIFDVRCYYVYIIT